MSAELNWVEWLFSPWAAPSPRWRKVKKCKRDAIDRVLAVPLMPPDTISLELLRAHCRRCGKCDMARNHPAWPPRNGPMLTGW